MIVSFLVDKLVCSVDDIYPLRDIQALLYCYCSLLCTEIRLLEGVDKLFSQTLTCIVTAFSQQLLLAVRGQLNTAVEYGDTNANSSKQWLQMVGKKGVLVHFEGTMLPKEVKILF